MKRRFAIFSKTTIWMIFLGVFGLLQFWCTFVIALYSGTQMEVFNAAIEKGAFLFFCSGIVVSKAIAVIFHEAIDNNDIATIFFHWFIPIVAIALVITLYFAVINNGNEITRNIAHDQIMVLCLSMFYAFLTRFQILIKREEYISTLKRSAVKSR